MDYQCSEKAIQEEKRLFRKAKKLRIILSPISIYNIHILMPCNIILYFRLLYFHVYNCALFSTLILYRRSLDTFYINSAFIDNDTKPFWKFVKAKRCDNNDISPLKEGGWLFCDSQSKADILNR